jgi:hypothetical protein
MYNTFREQFSMHKCSKWHLWEEKGAIRDQWGCETKMNTLRIQEAIIKKQ